MSQKIRQDRGLARIMDYADGEEGGAGSNRDIYCIVGTNVA